MTLDNALKAVAAELAAGPLDFVARYYWYAVRYQSSVYAFENETDMLDIAVNDFEGSYFWLRITGEIELTDGEQRTSCPGNYTARVPLALVVVCNASNPFAVDARLRRWANKASGGFGDIRQLTPLRLSVNKLEVLPLEGIAYDDEHRLLSPELQLVRLELAVWIEAPGPCVELPVCGPTGYVCATGQPPIPCPTPSGLTCDDVAQCGIVQRILEDLVEVQNGLQETDIDVANLDSRLGEAEADIQALALGLAAADGNISTLSTQVLGLQGDVALAQADATQALLNAAQAQMDANSALLQAAQALLWREQMRMLFEGVGEVYRTQVFTGNPTTINLTANNYTFQSYIHFLDANPSNIYLRVANAVAGTTASLALWLDDGTYSGVAAPGTPIWHSATPFSTASTGWVAVPTTGMAALVQGQRYFIGLICDSGVVTFTSFPTAQMSIIGASGATRVWRATNVGQTPAGTPPTLPTIAAANSANTIIYLLQP